MVGEQDCKDRAGCIGEGCFVRPLKVAVLLFSIHLLILCLFQLLPTYTTDDPSNLLQPQLMIVLTLDQNISIIITYQSGHEGHAPLLVSLVTDEPT